MKQKVITLKEWRETNRYTQAAFARLLEEECGIENIDRSNVWHWENGTKPRMSMRLCIEEVTGGKVKPASFL